MHLVNPFAHDSAFTFIYMAVLSFGLLGIVPFIPKYWFPEDFWMTANTLNVLVFLPCAIIFLIFSIGAIIFEGWWQMFVVAVALIVFLYAFQFMIELDL